jgi:hypothetical protein
MLEHEVSGAKTKDFSLPSFPMEDARAIKFLSRGSGVALKQVT